MSDDGDVMAVRVGDYKFKVGPITRQLREDYLKEVHAHQKSAAAE